MKQIYQSVDIVENNMHEACLFEARAAINPKANDHLFDLHEEICREVKPGVVYDLALATLPEDIDDIRHLVYHMPDIVLAVVEPGQPVRYIGINQIMVTDNQHKNLMKSACVVIDTDKLKEDLLLTNWGDAEIEVICKAVTQSDMINAINKNSRLFI